MGVGASRSEGNGGNFITINEILLTGNAGDIRVLASGVEEDKLDCRLG